MERDAATLKEPLLSGESEKPNQQELGALEGGQRQYSISRHVHLNDEAKNRAYRFRTNHVITSKYTVWNFLPKFLLNAFRQPVNAYFLFVSVLQLVPGNFLVSCSLSLLC